MLTEQEIMNGIQQCNGTERYWKNDLLHYQYTDGVKFMWESCEAYWLLVAISSHKRKEEFQVWELTVCETDTGKSATLTMREDSDEPILVSQSFQYTDFPLPKLKLYLINNVLLLPEEY